MNNLLLEAHDLHKTYVLGHRTLEVLRGVDLQVWISDDDRRLPQRIVLTYVNEAGEPQFRADFSDWNLRPPVPDSVFAFQPPASGRQVPFAVQVPAIVASAPAATSSAKEQP